MGYFRNVETADMHLIACKQPRIQKVQENNCNNQMHTEKENRGTILLSFLCVPRKGCKCRKQEGERGHAGNIYFPFLSLSLVYIISCLDGFQIQITLSAVISDNVLYQAQK